MKKLLILFGLCAFLTVPAFAADADSTKQADTTKHVEKKADTLKKTDSPTTGKGIGKTAGKSSAKKGNMITTKSGLKYTDEKIGTGPEAKPGDKVQVNYTGWLWENGQKGKQFDSGTYPLTLGAGQVIKGWDEGLVGMKAGGKRALIIPPDLAYGKSGFPGAIPPDATLIFDVELVSIGK